MLRMSWPRSARDGDSMPTGQIRFTAPLSMPRSSDLGIGGAADQQGRRGIFGPGVMAHARVAEIAIGEPQRAQEETSRNQ